MSDHEKQQLKNTVDIANLKLSFPVLLFISIVVSVSLTIWGGATWVANFSNGNNNFKKDQEKQSADLKFFFINQLHDIRLKDSIQISSEISGITNNENLHYQDFTYRIQSLREDCKRWQTTIIKGGVTEQRVNGDIVVHPYNTNK